ncbi:hypothetical protein Cgig2_004816 [Carnegiea gigantea]|uniref:Carboxyvinyl-carboxyphosphonate phosphorylmutase n=1 Tax=Carnegiea gigantea TaxID=171969 RepID=A0A9Q1QQF3_9CARY|nr:hypothetical protein Cgig2_004816 [Carnegiea gigantea]
MLTVVRAAARAAMKAASPGRRPMSKVARPTTTMQRLIEEQGIVLMPGVQDALSAAIVHKSGFSAGFVSGYASMLIIAMNLLCSTTEVTAVTRYVCSAVPDLPVIVDADTGGGNALNVQRFVQELIEAGAAGCFLEDQVWPKRCGKRRDHFVVPAEEHALKIEAARDAIEDADFFLVARTDALATSGLKEAISRANLYWEAGADGLFVEAPQNDEEL